MIRESCGGQHGLIQIYASSNSNSCLTKMNELRVIVAPSSL